MTADLDLDALTRLAEAATPFGWHGDDDPRDVDPATVVALVERLRAAEEAVDEALGWAADVVQSEARWQWERDRRGALGAQVVAQRMTIIEKCIRDQAQRMCESHRNAPESDRDGQNGLLRDSGPQNSANEGYA